MPHTLVIFGASGDLTRRKLIPALYALHRKNRLPDQTRIVGVSRTSIPSDEWRSMLRESTEEFDAGGFASETWMNSPSG